MNAEHRRPLAAFFLVLAFASVVMANGLRDQVVRVFVDSGAPRPLISAVVPDIVLGHSLHHAPGQGAGEPRPPRSPASTETLPIPSQPVTIAAQIAPAKPAHAQPHRASHVNRSTTRRPPSRCTSPRTAPVHVTTPSRAVDAGRPDSDHRPGTGDDTALVPAGGQAHTGLVGLRTPLLAPGPVTATRSTSSHSDHGVRGGSSTGGVHAVPGARPAATERPQATSGTAGQPRRLRRPRQPGRPRRPRRTTATAADHGDHGDHGDRGDHGDHGDHGNRGDHGGYGHHRH